MKTSKRSAAEAPVVLSIAGSDNSAGAGIQADLKTFTACGVYGLTAVTCVVAEIPGQVLDLQPVRPALLAAQVRLCFEAFPVVAVKTGMLYSKTLIRVVVEEILRARSHRSFALVVDPVMMASSGDPLLQPAAVRAYRRELFPLADLLTPNLDELAHLTGRPIANLIELTEAGRVLQASTGVAVLAKGGHLQGNEAVDVLCLPDKTFEYRAPYVVGGETHGTGCTYSAAIAAGLACSHSLPEAVARAKKLITQAIAEPHCFGQTRALRLFDPDNGKSQWTVGAQNRGTFS